MNDTKKSTYDETGKQIKIFNRKLWNIHIAVDSLRKYFR